ncbi:hypothetical protein SAMN02910292_01156 [Lachnospiraceae bacterium XBB2008]|nr:hypothetical protein SAMN02910292_01156 [Lachnospiraceae bacterium XBB2008]
MARPKQIDDNELIKLISRYFQEHCTGNIKKMKYEAIANYIRENGYPNYMASSLRRNATAKKYIEGLKEISTDEIISTVVTYKSLNIDEFIQNNHSANELRRSLAELDAYYKRVADSAAQIFNEHNSLIKKNEELKAALDENTSNLTKAEEKQKKANAELAALKKEIMVLNSVIKTYVYPEIANELLSKERVKIKTTGVIDTEKMDKQIVTAKTPVNNSKSGSNVINGLFENIK